MPSWTHRTRKQLFRYLTVKEKEKRYHNHVHMRPGDVTSTSDVFYLVSTLGPEDLIYLPTSYSILEGRTARQFMRYGEFVSIGTQEKNMIKSAKYALGFDTDTIPAGVSWSTKDVISQLTFLSAIHGQIIVEVVEGEHADELFKFQGMTRERIVVTPNYRENNIGCIVPSRSRQGITMHIISINNPPGILSGFEWYDTVTKHVCGDTTFNKELNVGAQVTGIEDHSVAALIMAERFMRNFSPFKSSLVLPPTKEFADVNRKLANQFVKLEWKRGEVTPRNLNEGELNSLLGSYINIRRKRLGRNVGDNMFLDSMEEFERELRKDNYILEILFPS